jgi:hypothetical protein
VQEKIQAARIQICEVADKKGKNGGMAVRSPFCHGYLSILHTAAANSPPIMGAAQNSQS